MTFQVNDLDDETKKLLADARAILGISVVVDVALAKTPAGEPKLIVTKKTLGELGMTISSVPS